MKPYLSDINLLSDLKLICLNQNQNSTKWEKMKKIKMPLGNHTNHPLPHPKNKWNVRFAWFNYNDTEIFRDTEKDIENKIKAYSDQGINHLITFSIAHFRWSFYPWWPLLVDTLKKIVSVCHKHNIYITEHHSASHIYYPYDDKSKEQLNINFTMKNSSLQSWPGLIDYCLDNPVINGQRRSSLLQVDGRTGVPGAAASYKAMAFCYNNPFYKEEYFKHLEAIYKTGVDGIMTDDVQWVGMDSCACETCTKLFKEQTGYDFPKPYFWPDWRNKRDESYRAWLKFRTNSVENFHNEVKCHYERLGFSPLRPNYNSGPLWQEPSAYCYDRLPALDWCFNECYSHGIIRFSWPYYLMSQLHHRMLGLEKGVPSGMLFYASSENLMIFSWALSRLAGAYYTNIPNRKGKILNEKPIRDFESRFMTSMFDCDMLASVAFLYSWHNKIMNPEYNASKIQFWIQSCLLNGIPCELASSENPKSWSKYKILVSDGIGVLSEEEIQSLKKFADNGGLLLIGGNFGAFDRLGARRSRETAENILGLDIPTADDFDDNNISIKRGNIIFINPLFGYPGDRNLREAIFVSKTLLDDQHQQHLSILCRSTSPTNPVKYDGRFLKVESAAKQVTDFFNELLGAEGVYSVSNLPRLVLASPFLSKNRTVTINILNASGTLDFPAQKDIFEKDEIISYPNLPTNSLIKFKLKKLPLLREETNYSATFQTLECNDCMPLDMEWENETVTINLPAILLKSYGMIQLKRK